MGIKNIQAKHDLATAVYRGEINGLNTKEISDLYSISNAVCLKFLSRIISGKVLDPVFYPFRFIELDEGVEIQDGRTFVKSNCGDFEEGKTGCVNHYIWFLN